MIQLGRVQLLLMAALVLLGAALALRAWSGPFSLSISVNSPVNVQCLFGLCLNVLLLGRRDQQQKR